MLGPSLYRDGQDGPGHGHAGGGTSARGLRPTASEPAQGGAVQASTRRLGKP